MLKGTQTVHLLKGSGREHELLDVLMCKGRVREMGNHKAEAYMDGGVPQRSLALGHVPDPFYD